MVHSMSITYHPNLYIRWNIGKVFWTSYNIFVTSLMPGVQSCKNHFILAVLKGRCKQLAAITAHLPNGPYT